MYTDKISSKICKLVPLNFHRIHVYLLLSKQIVSSVIHCQFVVNQMSECPAAAQCSLQSSLSLPIYY
jgi:hypothetical protein